MGPFCRVLCSLTSTADAQKKARNAQEKGNDQRRASSATLEGHLSFALKYEGLDLLVLKSRFRATGPGPIEAIVRATPTGSYARRIWFLYEWLLGTELDLPRPGKALMPS
jgi:hypothetical protein